MVHLNAGTTQRKKETATARAGCGGSVPGYNWECIPTDSVVLHHARIDEILQWTKEHLDAYLTSADVIIDQRDEPG
jgi:hypothetical protein